MNEVAAKLNKWERILDALSGHELDLFLQHYSAEGKKYLLSDGKSGKYDELDYCIHVSINPGIPMREVCLFKETVR